MPHILVIGAGVIGLQTANDLLDAGYKVTILAKHWPGDESIEYASPWAGAIWRPQGSASETEVCDWQMQSYKYWTEIIEKRPGEAEEMGIQLLPLTLLTSTSTPPPWYTTLLPALPSPPSPLPSTSHTFPSIVIHPPKYLSHLLTRALSLNAIRIRATLPASTFPLALATTLSHVDGKEKVDLVVNCTGLGASHLCDGNMYPVRGQTAVVRFHPAPTVRRVLLYDSTPVTYVVPRGGRGAEDTYLVGGTLDRGDWEGESLSEVKADILERVRRVVRGWASDGVEIEVLREQVGLRPGREGGARVEGEEVEVGERVVKVVHEYGHGGAGYQNSIGSSKKVVGIVREMLGG